MKRRSKFILGGTALLMLSCIGWCASPCVSAWARWGLVVDECPDGTPILSAELSGYGLERGQEGWVSVELRGRFLHGRYGYVTDAPLRRGSVALRLEVEGAEPIPLDCDWDRNAGYRTCDLKLPEDIPDGDHVLVATVDTALDEEPVDVRVALPLFRPALVHLLPDRPIYQPGDTIRFRSLTLARGSFEPIDDRPGTWTVTSPDGELLLEERSAGGPWGIAESSFPLAPDAPVGNWVLTWRSGDDSARVSVRVEPFTLPRFTVEAQAEEPWYGEGDAPAISGVVRYTSGAPVADAELQIQLAQSGPWPPPSEWLEPRRLSTDSAGRFRLELPEVPSDLVGASGISARIVATDSAGEQQVGAARLLLSEDPVAVDAVTELGVGGELVSDFNNRVYLRVTSPDGRALGGETVKVRNRWDSRDEGRTLEADADGVVAFQVDPGQPVNVEIPAQPVRPQESEAVAPVQLQSARAALSDRGLTIGERTDLDAIGRRLEGCADRVASEELVSIALITRGGFVTEAMGSSPLLDAVDRCVARVAKGASLGNGEEIFHVGWRLRAPEDAVKLKADVRTLAGSMPEDSAEDFVEQLLGDAQACVQELRAGGAMPEKLVWRSRKGGGAPELRWIPDPDGLAGASAMSCVRGAFSGLRMDIGASTPESVGVVELRIEVPPPKRTVIPQATVRPGYEFLVEVDGVGVTTWRTQPGRVPAQRLRPTEVLVKQGETFGVDLLRGPGFRGSLPMGLTLKRGDSPVQYCPRTPDDYKDHEDHYSEDCPKVLDDNRVLFVAKDEGFHEVSWGEARAVIYVPPAAALSVEVSSDKPAYAPGATATLSVKTSSPAVVSLTGVDEALGQLASLPAPGELGELTVTARSDTPAFGIYDATALATGRVRGANAQMAAVQRVTVLGETSPVPPPRTISGGHATDEEEILASVFYELLSDAQRAVRAWEAKAPEGETLSNKTMAELWGEMLDAREEAGAPVEDAWSRRMELWRLPEDLLALTEPRLLVSDGTRIPDDIEPWQQWVMTEMER
ncbi:MAG: hypothetical protein H6741_03655 [Alphaproteobacteria bacterium]|nr:hypothetical protein [Alphaproteobacteria bacterium]